MAEKPDEIKQEEHDLKEYLQGDSALSRAYRAEEKPRVSAHLDKAILSAANAAVKLEQPATMTNSPSAKSWYVPLSIAAVLTLCVGLVFTIYQETDQELLTAPKSEYDMDVVTVPMQSGILEEAHIAEKKNRQENRSKAMLDETERSMDVDSDKNIPPAPAIESFEKKKTALQKKPKLREKTMGSSLQREEEKEIDDALLSEMPSETDPGIGLGGSGAIDAKKDSSTQMMFDAPHIPDGRTRPERLEAADVKRQKQMVIEDLNNRLGGVELRSAEQTLEADLTATTELRYRQTEEDLPRQEKVLDGDLLKKETLPPDMVMEEFNSSVIPSADKVLTPEQWLEQINDLWVSGDQQAAKDNLKQFFAAYPNYPKEDIKTNLDPQIDFMKYAR